MNLFLIYLSLIQPPKEKDNNEDLYESSSKISF